MSALLFQFRVYHFVGCRSVATSLRNLVCLTQAISPARIRWHSRLMDRPIECAQADHCFVAADGDPVYIITCLCLLHLHHYCNTTFAPNKFYSTNLLHHASFALESRSFFNHKPYHAKLNRNMRIQCKPACKTKRRIQSSCVRVNT